MFLQRATTNQPLKLEPERSSELGESLRSMGVTLSLHELDGYATGLKVAQGAVSPEAVFASLVSASPEKASPESDSPGNDSPGSKPSDSLLAHLKQEISGQFHPFEQPDDFIRWVRGLAKALGKRPADLMALLKSSRQEAATVALHCMALSDTVAEADMLALTIGPNLRRDLAADLRRRSLSELAAMQAAFVAALRQAYREGLPETDDTDVLRLGGSGALQQLIMSVPQTGRPTIRREGKKILPNAPCPCGSGKKYKKCCGAVQTA
ncbi:SEC-C metal-binding domain-containing protein [Deinococcus sp.]|uniref:YecA family protein n=1 Tax=Deinococcus sp. TaxID=47478 RepID=UPI0025C21A7B|nr:SEC-C metal-binding domain-containing protein [Deinococcus sp.]